MNIYLVESIENRITFSLLNQEAWQQGNIYIYRPTELCLSGLSVWFVWSVCLVCLSTWFVCPHILCAYSCTLCQEDSQRFLWSTKIWIEKNSVKISLLPLLKILLLLFSSFLDFFLLLLLLPSVSSPFSFLSLLFLLPSLAKTDWRTERHKQKDKGYDRQSPDWYTKELSDRHN